jgi:hypothetical protein
MCKYYAHAFSCKHQTLTFARFCTPANFTQTPCAKRTIWHTIGMDEVCDECRIWYPDHPCPPSGAGAGGPVRGALVGGALVGMYKPAGKGRRGL